MEDALKTGAWLKPNTFMDIISPNAKASPRSKPNKSNTLMRSAVKKPDFVAKDSAPKDYVSQPVALTAERRDLSESASLTDRSPLISRFSAADGYDDQPQNNDLASSFEAAPVETPDVSPAAFEAMDAQPMALAMEQPGINIFKNPLPSIDYAKPVEAAVSRWNALKRVSGWSVLAVLLVGLVAGGILINRNLGRVELYLASSKAGFSATLPTDAPAGYSLKGISTAKGAIAASYTSNSDGRSYTLNEKSTTSNQQLNSYVQTQAGLNFQAVNTDSKTVYIYNGHNATWASNGIWYVLQDNNSLSDHQIINIADSQ